MWRTKTTVDRLVRIKNLKGAVVWIRLSSVYVVIDKEKSDDGPSPSCSIWLRGGEWIDAPGDADIVVRMLFGDEGIDDREKIDGT
jgi:hypothetical protein